MNREARDKTIRRMWPIASGPEIAAAVGLDKTSVLRRAKTLDLPPKGGSTFDARISDMWPALTAAVIATTLGVEVSTVKRRARALGLIAKAPPAAPKAPPRPAPKAPPRPAPKAPPRPAPMPLRRPVPAAAAAPGESPRLDYVPLPPVRPAGPNSRILADSPRVACRFPVGDAPEGRADLQLLCCEPVEASGCPYCAEHAALAYYRKKGTKK